MTPKITTGVNSVATTLMLQKFNDYYQVVVEFYEKELNIVDESMISEIEETLNFINKSYEENKKNPNIPWMEKTIECWKNEMYVVAEEASYIEEKVDENLLIQYNNLYEKIYCDLIDALEETPSWATRAWLMFKKNIFDIEVCHPFAPINPEYMKKFLKTYENVCFYER